MPRSTCAASVERSGRAPRHGVLVYASCGVAVHNGGWRRRARVLRQRAAARASAGRATVPQYEPPEAPAGGRVVLFSQIKECAGIVETFVRHYAALGLYKLILYLDDPSDVAQDVLHASGWVESGFVELVSVDEKLSRVWPSMPSWSRVGQYSGMEVQSRQILNNEHALLRAKELGADWLLHVDSDELLCLPEMAPAFFSGLSARGCSMYTFSNVEGVPESAESVDVLKSVRVFRQNLGLVPRNPKAGTAFFSWQLRLGGFFISYENGKTAVNVHRAVKCLSVCMWEVEPQLYPGKKSAADGSTCTWFTNNKMLWDAAMDRRKEGRLTGGEEVPQFDDRRDAFLLHFCVCDFAAFWRKRWTQLGYLSASDQFRVRASSGAMMGRFYRLQREGREAEARELYETMCVCECKDTIASQVAAGVLLTADPEHPSGSGGPRWQPSPRTVPYRELATAADARGRAFDAWTLLGKALEAAAEDGTGTNEVAAMHRRRAECGLASCIASCTLSDSLSALGLGDIAAFLPHAQAMQALGRNADAMEVVENGLRALGDKEHESAAALRSLKSQLRSTLAQGGGKDSKSGVLREKGLPTPAELQRAVAQAVSPDPKGSRLYNALMPVATSWWQEVGADQEKYLQALTQAASTTRRDLVAVDQSVRPQPIKFVREIWDAHERELKITGALVGDLEPIAGLWSTLASACRQAMGEGDVPVVVAGCNREGESLHKAWQLMSALAAEVQRVFHMRELQVLSELRISRPPAGDSTRGPEVDNGGLLPDNRREVSFRIFIPVDGKEPGPDATLMLHTKDGEKTTSYDLRAGRLFAWWSRPTFHQVLGGHPYFAVSCWAVTPQKGDKVATGSGQRPPDRQST